MDISKLLNNVKNVDDYISVTQEINDKYKDSEVKLNISTVLSLKSMKSLEVECLNKSYENGAACTIFGRLLALPPSRTWRVVGKEMIRLLQYWLEAVRKYMMHHTEHWWAFLEILLRFIDELSTKDVYMPNALTQMTAACLLDMATKREPLPHQRYAILHCHNMVCEKSTRDIRIALQDEMKMYFPKLGHLVCGVGHLPAQYSALEALLRWLVERKSRAAREAAARACLPPGLCPPPARRRFIDSCWLNFYKEARDFLNALNEAKGLVTSIVCNRLAIGDVIVISGAENHRTWIDLNTADRSLTVLLEPRVVSCVDAVQALRITTDDADTAELMSVSEEIRLLVHTYAPPQLCPSGAFVAARCDVTFTIAPKADLSKLDTALKHTFDDKYQLLLDLDTYMPPSPDPSRDSRSQYNSGEETRFSLPEEVKRPEVPVIVKSGYQKASKTLCPNSPSSVSTSSLAQLHEKLKALPRAPFDRVHQKFVSVDPNLSCVVELSETEDKSFQSRTTLKLTQAGITRRRVQKKAESDSEIVKPKSISRCISPVDKENNVSCLFVATIGSADDSVINDTIESLSKHREFNNETIVDLLVQEALQAKSNAKASNNAVIEKRTTNIQINTEVIENTPDEKHNKNTSKKFQNDEQKKVCTVVSKSTTDDESNTEAILETPGLDTSSKSKLFRKTYLAKSNSKSASKQRLTNNPETTLCKRTKGDTITEGFYSDTSEDISVNFLMPKNNITAYDEHSDQTEVLDCLNNLLDKVCDLEQYMKCVNRDNNILSQNNTSEDQGAVSKKDAGKSQKNIKITFKAANIKNKKVSKNTRKIKSPVKKEDNEPTRKRRNIIRKDNVKMKTKTVIESVIIKESETVENNDETVTPQVKRKRKLFSPKDDLFKENRDVNTPADDEELPLSKKSHSRKNINPSSSLYSDIEKERQQYPLQRSRRILTKKSIGKVEPLSPRSKKINDDFERLKIIESNEQIKVVDKKSTEVYNFTSDSDDDFVKKNNNLKKGTSTSTIASHEPAKAKRNVRQKGKTNSSKESGDEYKKPKPSDKKKLSKKTSRNKTNLPLESITDLVDERMREAGTDILNTSAVVENLEDSPKLVDVELELKDPPQTEPINDIEEHNTATDKKKKSTKTRGKSKKEILKSDSDKEANRTLSPLPGLLVEAVPTRKDDMDVSDVQNLLEKYHENPDAINDTTNTDMLIENDTTNFTSKDKVYHKKSSPEKLNKKGLKGAKSNHKDVKDPVNEIRDSNSEKSFCSVGITAHGETGESPPSPEIISKTMRPREIEYLSESMRNYYLKLNQQVNASFCDGKAIQKEHTPSSRSPVVSVARLSPEDISRWLPSRRTSESDSYSNINEAPNSAGQTELKEPNPDHIFKKSPDKTIPDVISGSQKLLKPTLDSTKESSPSPSITKISYEEFQKLLPTPCTSKYNIREDRYTQREDNGRSQHDYNTRYKTKALTRLDSDEKSSGKLAKQTSKVSKDSSSNISAQSIQRIHSNSKQDKNNPKSAMVTKVDEKLPRMTKKRKKNFISPVKSLECVRERRGSDDESRIKLDHKSEYKSIQSKVTPTKSAHQVLSPILYSQKRILKRPEVKANSSKNRNTSPKESTSPMLARKRAKLDQQRTLSEESAPGDSVTNRRLYESSTSKANVSSVEIDVVMDYVLEKLDTTLVEIDHNTSNISMKMFSELQGQLNNHKEERYRMCRDIATDIIGILAQKMDDLEKKSRKMDDKFMSDLKKSTLDLIREDCEQKRAMVLILKQDVQAVADHLRRGGH